MSPGPVGATGLEERTPRVLHVLEALEGGTARHLVDVVRWTERVEHHVALPTRRVGGLTDEGAAPALRALGATVHPLAMTRTPVTGANGRALMELGRLVVGVRPDVVHGHSSIGGLVARVAGTAMRRRTVYTPNGITDVRAGVLVERALGPLTDRFVAVSPSEAARARSLHLVRPARLRVVPNGIDPDPRGPPIDLREVLGVPAGPPLVGTVSRLVPQKDPLTWVAMAAHVVAAQPDTRFVIIGDGVLRPEVTAALAAAGLGGVIHLVPHLPDAVRALGSLDAFVLSSVFEGAPYAPMEAMLAGTPVVLTDVAGSTDLVTDGVDGRLVPPQDPTALAGAVVELLRRPEEATRLGAEGRRTVVDRFSGPAMGRGMEAVYRELLDASDGASTPSGPRRRRRKRPDRRAGAASPPS